MSTLINEITLAYENLRRHEGDLAIARSQIRVGKKRIAAARKALDGLLDERASGKNRLPLFDREPEPGDEATPAKVPGGARKSKAGT